jgi:hypothetical protein
MTMPICPPCASQVLVRFYFGIGLRGVDADVMFGKGRGCCGG